jgi:hypothetical protein
LGKSSAKLSEWKIVLIHDGFEVLASGEAAAETVLDAR